MAKRKKNIGDFQEALLSNTQLMKDADISSNDEEVKVERLSLQIDQEVLNDFKILAKYMDVEHEELIQQALRHFLGLKSIKLETAKRKFKTEE